MIFKNNDNVIYTGELPFPDELLGGVGHVCFKYMKKHGEKIAQVDSRTGQTNTFKSLLQKCIRVALFLRNKGIQKGDIVATFNNVGLNAPVPVLASYFTGALPIFMDTGLALENVTHLLKLTIPKILFSVPEGLDLIKTAIRNADVDTEIVIFGNDENYDFLQPQVDEDDFQPVYVTDIKQTAALFASSGSTGYPKAVCTSHYILVCNPLGEGEEIEEEKDIERIEFETSKTKDFTVVLAVDSLYWKIEMIRIIQTIVKGNCQILATFDATNIWKLIDKYKVNVLHLVPGNIADFCRVGKPASISVNSLYKIYSAGSKLSKNVVLSLQQLLPDVDIYQMYGQTECGVITEFRTSNKIHRAIFKKDPVCVGLPTRGMSIRVVDLNSGENLGPNQHGELHVKSVKVMNGYYRQASADEIDENGWLKTGDIVYYDENFCFYIVERIKDYFIYKHWQISPAIIEDVLLSHPAVRSCVVIGKPEVGSGELPLGVVILNEGFSEIPAKYIEKFVEERISDRNRLRGGIVFVDKFPMTTTGKIKRRELKKIILEQIK